MATSRPHTRQNHEAEKLLKTKGQKRAFSKNEAENILKTSKLLKIIGIPRNRTK
jgi:hypothetical protein